MGKVIITLRIMPEDLDVDIDSILDKVKEEISKIGGNYLQHYTKPLAFGINAIEVKFTYPDKEFKEEEFIERVSSIKGVSSVEIINVTLSSI